MQNVRRFLQVMRFQIHIISADRGQPEEIIHIGVMKFSQSNQYRSRDIPLPQFVIAVNLLRAVQIFRDVTLFQIGVLSYR